jgi:hypothetical protein
VVALQPLLFGGQDPESGRGLHGVVPPSYATVVSGKGKAPMSGPDQVATSHGGPQQATQVATGVGGFMVDTRRVAPQLCREVVDEGWQVVS